MLLGALSAGTTIGKFRMSLSTKTTSVLKDSKVAIFTTNML
jgi:hypothetical protein